MRASAKKASRPSIHELLPIETGGVEARHGFGVQDHASAGFCIKMLSDEELEQVWCETQDDITLLWNEGESEIVEFVQVKSAEMDQLWSMAELCKREKSKKGDGSGTSIIERSLANDRCREFTRFRLVTVRPMRGTLEILRLPIESQERKANANKATTLKQEIAKRVGEYKSLNGHGCEYWVDHIQWDVCDSTDAIKNKNLLKLVAAVEARGEYLAYDQIDELYAKLLNLVRDAAMERDVRAKKKITRGQFREWFARAIESANPHSAVGGARMKEKMVAAGIAGDQIATALELKRRYRLEVLTSKYLKMDQRRLMEGEIQAKLQQLRAMLDAGEMVSDGLEFHSICLQALDSIRAGLIASPIPPLDLMQGYLYNLTDRCLHRFMRVSA